MMMRAIVVLLFATAPAAAQRRDDLVPGTSRDPMQLLVLRDPGAVDSPLVPGIAMRGGALEDTIVLFDGFEIPRVVHDDGKLSIFPRASVTSDSFASGAGAEYGRGSSFVSIQSLHASQQEHAVELDPSGVELQGLIPHYMGTRLEVTGALRIGLFGPHPMDSSYRFEWAMGHRWHVAVSAFSTLESLRSISRAVLGGTYREGCWTAQVAASSMIADDHPDTERPEQGWDETTIDTRGDLGCNIGEVAGLHRFGFRVGEQTSFSRYDLDIAGPLLPHEGWPEPETPDAFDVSTRVKRIEWLLDGAVWGSLFANLSHEIRATTELRLEAFGDYVTMQPRGKLEITPSKEERIRLSAGAYRRPPEQIAEIVAGNLHPERTTEIALDVSHVDARGWASTSVYYVDRTRLIERDNEGVLANTGFGTAYGVEAQSGVRLGPWVVRMLATLSKSVRVDHLRGYERPSQYSQPFRVDGLVYWERGRWRLGARARISAGLPSTPIEGAVYNSDHDYYEPLFDRTYSARTPTLYRFDLRADHSWSLPRGFSLAAYADLQSSFGTLEYVYSYDYRERIAKKPDPLFPFVGVRGSL